MKRNVFNFLKEEKILKRILIYLLIFILVCFIIPAMLTKRTKTTIAQEYINNNLEQNIIKEQDNGEKQQNYQYNKYGTITLLHKKTGETEQVNLDDYLCNVVSAEMPADYEEEALKAQAIVARTYTIYKMQNKKSIHNR